MALPAAEAETGDAAGDGAAAGAVAGGARTRRRHRRRPLGQTGRYTLQRRRNGLGIRRYLRLPSSLVTKRRLRMCTHQLTTDFDSTFGFRSETEDRTLPTARFPLKLARSKQWLRIADMAVYYIGDWRGSYLFRRASITKINHHQRTLNQSWHGREDRDQAGDGELGP